MRLLLALATASLFSSGVYLMMKRDMVRVIWGLVLVSQGTNLYLLSSGRIGGDAPVIAHSASATGESARLLVLNDPLPQALILTAIVIGFGVTGFALVLALRLFREQDTIDVEEMS